MNRPAGITISAVIVLLGSGFTLLCAPLMFIALLSAPPPVSEVPPFLNSVMVVMGAVTIGFAAWGIASGIGLLRLREWARISLLVYSGLLVFFSLPSVAFAFLLPMLSTAGNDNRFPRGMSIVMAIFYGVLAALGVFWLWYFNTRPIKERFTARAASLPSNLSTPQPTPQPTSSPARPLSISIIGWYMVITGVLFMPSMLFLRLPVLLLGLLLTGRMKLLAVLAMTATQLVLGAGLLRLKPWARIGAIYYFCFSLVNSFAMVLLPGSQARWSQVQAQTRDWLGIPAGPAAPDMHLMLWFGVAFALPLFGVQLWFLFTTKRAFLPDSALH